MDFNYPANNYLGCWRQHYLQQSQTPFRQSQKVRYSEAQLSIHSKHDYEFKPEIQRGASMCTGKVGRNEQQRDELQEERQEEKRKGK